MLPGQRLKSGLESEADITEGLQLAAELVIGSQSISTIDRRWSTTHVDCECRGLNDLITSGAVLKGHFCMVRDTSIAMDSNPDCKCHQLLSFVSIAFVAVAAIDSEAKAFIA